MPPLQVKGTARVFLLGSVLLAGNYTATAQEKPHRAAATQERPVSQVAFVPFAVWKAAVLSGNKEGLKALYVSDPRASAKTPRGTIADPSNEESEFWSRLSSLGLTDMLAKILEQTSPQPGAVSLVLRIELTFQSGNKTQRALVSASQLWVSQGEQWRIFVTQRSDLLPLPALHLPEPKIPDTHLYPDPAEARKDLDVALASAKIDHKRVLVVFGANWCYDCHVLDTAMKSKELAALVTTNYHVVHINIAEGKSNADLARRFRVPLDKGIPSLAVLDSDGHLITSQKNGEFESAAKIGMRDVSEFLRHWEPNASR
jgi:thioredoxin 1